MQKWPVQAGTVVPKVGRELSLLRMALNMQNADYYMFFILWNELESTKSWAIQIADSIEKKRKTHARILSYYDSDSEDQPAKRKRKWRSEHAV